MINLISLIAIMIFLTGCEAVRQDKPLEPVRSRVQKFQDGPVTCYLYDGSEGDSISCLVIPEDER